MKKYKELEANRSHQGVSLLKAAAAVMSSNAHITAELAGLHAALGQLAAVQSSTHTTATASNPPEKKQITAVSDGSGAGSPEAYQEMIKRNWHGRLGRTHMADVDQMLDLARKELDSYLRRTISAAAPVGGNYTEINADTVFATLSAFGLRLEDRGALADVTIFIDSTDLQVPTTARILNYSAHYYTTRANKFDCYWMALALETLLELAQYRGLFGADGFLKS